MSGRRKKSAYTRKAYETKKPGTNTSEPFVALYSTLLFSDAWLDLKPRAQMLYIYMRHQFGNGKGELADGQFFFNQALWKDKLYTNKNSFISDVKALVAHGFIDIVESGRFTRTKSIYAYSDRWWTWSRESEDAK